MAYLFRHNGTDPVAEVALKQPRLCEIFEENLDQECYIYYEKEHLSTLVVNEGWFIPNKPGRYFIKFSDEHNIRIFEEASEKLRLIADKYGHDRDDSGCFESNEDTGLGKSSTAAEDQWRQKILDIRRFEEGYRARIITEDADLRTKEEWKKIEDLSLQDQSVHMVKICGKNRRVSLRNELANDEIDLYYQIRVDISDIFQEYPGLVEKFCVIVSGLPRGITPFLKYLERKYYEKLKYISSNQLYIFSKKQNGESTGYFVIIWDSPKNADKCLEHFYYYDIDPGNRNLRAYSMRDVVNVTKEKAMVFPPLRAFLKALPPGIDLLHVEHLPSKHIAALVNELKPKNLKICPRTKDTIPDDLFPKIPENVIFQCGRASQYEDFLRYVSLHRSFKVEFQFEKPDPVENKYSKWGRNFIEDWIMGQLDDGQNTHLEMTHFYREHEVVEPLLDTFFKWIEGNGLRNITDTIVNTADLEDSTTIFLMARNRQDALERRLIIYNIQKDVRETLTIVKMDNFDANGKKSQNSGTTQIQTSDDTKKQS